MFEQIVKNLESWSQKKINKDFYVTEQEFDDFCKEFLFEELKGNNRLGKAFCEKYSEENFILSTFTNNKIAKEHIRTFYIK
jgi:hypothetical protein